MRLPFIFSLCLFASNCLFAQFDSWSFSCYSYFDTPFKTYTINNVDPQGSTIIPSANFGQLFYLERNFSFNNGIGFLVGGGYAYSQLNADMVSTQQLLSKPSGRDHVLNFIDNGFDYISVYSGASYSKILKEQLALQLSLKIGAYKIQTGRGRVNSFIQIENGEALQLLDAGFVYNESDQIFMMIFPEAKLSYIMKKIPLGFSVGLAGFYSPNSYLGGHITLNGDLDDYMVYLYDRLQSIGLSLGVSYLLN